MHKKHMFFLRVFQKITLFACVFCAFFISPVFATLPAGYTELEYIESTGAQYIDTGIKTNSNLGVHIDFQYTVQNTNEKILFGHISPNFAFWCTNKQFTYAYKPSTGYTDKFLVNDIDTISRHTLDLNFNNDKKVKFDDIINQLPQDNFTANNNLYLFAAFYSATGAYHSAPARIFSAQITNGSNLVRNFVPTRRNSDGEIGMYDTVSDTFFTNQGTGDFIAGPIAHCKTVSTDGVTCTECESGYKLDSNGVCAGVIEIATTKMVDEEFAATEAKLATTVQTIESVVSRTIAQTGQIATLQEEKQTRPDENCPANMKCLLVQDEDGTPHWYPIIEP